MHVGFMHVSIRFIGILRYMCFIINRDSYPPLGAPLCMPISECPLANSIRLLKTSEKRIKFVSVRSSGTWQVVCNECIVPEKYIVILRPRCALYNLQWVRYKTNIFPMLAALGASGTSQMPKVIVPTVLTDPHKSNEIGLLWHHISAFLGYLIGSYAPFGTPFGPEAAPKSSFS